MKGKTHFIFAFLFLLIVLLFSQINFDFLYLSLFLLVGTMFVDIDHIDSYFGRNFKFIGYIFDHRGFFHSIFALILFSLFFHAFFGLYYATFFAIGYFLHLFFDSLTKEGIKPFLYGIKFKGYIKVGSITENLLFYLSCLLSFIFIIIIFYIK